MPKLLEETLQETVRVLEAAKARGEKVTAPAKSLPYVSAFAEVMNAGSMGISVLDQKSEMASYADY
ncbi:hypothetical protein GMST_05060 [Geomonas silvestris]|uniref:Uncharacterized protein n=2 Tax=Geomonas silvestris TaxID=2740184 RepID=A0A6V8MDW2_9BACT|nr:hypothetical protein GMST_05060 [Geomonas silvestris]